MPKNPKYSGGNPGFWTLTMGGMRPSKEVGSEEFDTKYHFSVTKPPPEGLLL